MDIPLISNPSENRGPDMLGATLTTTILATFVVSLRLWVRTRSRAFGSDDVMMALAMAFSISSVGLLISAVKDGGLGRHAGDVSRETSLYGSKMVVFYLPVSTLALLCAKVSIGIALFRIAVTRFWKRTILGVGTFTVLWGVANILALFLECDDIRAEWDHSLPAHCMPGRDIEILAKVNTVVNILTDIAFAVAIPIPMLWDLHVSQRTKYTLWGVFGLGLFACAAAIIKLVYFLLLPGFGDILFDDCYVLIWTVTECNVGIIAGSLPALRLIMRSVLGSTSKSGGLSGRTKSNAYGTGTGKAFRGTLSKSAGRWATLSSSKGGERLDDETGSERAFNMGAGDYELEAQTKATGKSRTVVVGGRGTASPDETEWEESQVQLPSGRNIQKTTTTTVTYS